MERVVGIGGIFLKARDPQALAAWYRDHLGLPVAPGASHGVFTRGASEGPAAGGTGGTPEQTVWSAFPADTAYFAPSAAPFMVSYRVASLDRMLAQLRAAGATVDDRVEAHEYGRFGWALDPEDNRFELWEPAGPGV